MRGLLHDLEGAYEFEPQLFPEHPVDVFKRNIFVHPFHEEDPKGLVDLLGADNVLFGSDYPHPEGMSDPLAVRRRPRGPPRGGHRQGDGRQPQPPHERRVSRPGSSPWCGPRVPAFPTSRPPAAT